MFSPFPGAASLKTCRVRWRIPAIDAQFCYAAMGEIG
jgi:hypothetical protein